MDAKEREQLKAELKAELSAELRAYLVATRAGDDELDEIRKRLERDGKYPPKYKTLLSLMYWVKNDDDYNAAFHSDHSATASWFGVVPGTQRADLVNKIGDIHDHTHSSSDFKKGLITLFTDYLIEELINGNPHPLNANVVRDDENLEVIKARLKADGKYPAKYKTLLSLMYWVKNDDDFHAAFYNDPVATAKWFGVVKASSVKQLRKIHDHTGNSSALESDLTTLFTDDLADELIKGSPHPFW